MAGGRFDLNDYIDVDARIDQFWRQHPAGAIRTEVVWVNADGSSLAVRASVYRQCEQPQPDATGLAQEYAGGGGANKTSWWENCETSAIGRALANLGMAISKRASREEIMKIQRHEQGTTAGATAAPPSPAASQEQQKVTEWADEKLLAFYGTAGRKEAHLRRATEVYFSRAATHDDLKARWRTAKQAGLAGEIANEVGKARAALLAAGLAIATPPAADPPDDDDLTAVVGPPTTTVAPNNAKLIALVLLVAAQYGKTEESLLALVQQLYRQPSLDTLSNDQLNSLLNWLRASGGETQAAG